MMIKSRQAGSSAVVLLLANFIAYGNVLTIFGATVPLMRESFAWSYAVTGLVLGSGAVTFFLSTFAAGFLVQRIRPQVLLVGGLCLGAASLSLFARWPSPGLNVLLNAAVGVYMGIMEVITNYEAIRLEKGGRSRLMTLLHAGFSIGAIAGPLAVGALLRLGGSWQAVYPLSGGLLLAMAVLFLLFPFPEYGKEQGQPRSRSLALLREPLLLLLTLGLILGVGAELGVTSWSAEYFTRVLAAPAPLAAFSVSALWIGLLAGRLALSAGYRGTRQDVVLLVLSLFSAACLFALRAVASAPAALAFMLLLGVGFSGIYPLILTLTGRAFRSSAAVGFITTGGGIGSFSFPFLFAAITQAVGLRGGFLFLAFLPLGAAAVAAVLTLRESRRSGGQPAGTGRGRA